ncbi:uncharacterized protein [Arachis hypogaea]|uniref:uncharacterized protein n=1 Tax=Arachis hypogaea TaxID=3818 RepID=UPI003B210172
MYMLQKVHEGCRRHHLGEKSLAQKVIQAGFYWLTLMKDTMEYVKKCDKCQQHGNFHQTPPHELVSVIPTRPFAKWDLDLLGPFSQEPGQKNRQVEAANKVILNVLKKRFNEHLDSWADEVWSVLWSYRTTVHSTTNETPFRLIYDEKAIIPAELQEPSPRMLLETSATHERLDLIDEVKGIANLAEQALK